MLKDASENLNSETHNEQNRNYKFRFEHVNVEF